MQIQRTVEATAPPAAAFAYLSDFTTTTEWDPGTVQTVLRSGSGGVGTTYLNTSRFAGRESQVTYTVETLEEGRHFALRGVNKSLVAHDTMTFRETAEGTEVRYVAEFGFKGVEGVTYCYDLHATLLHLLGIDHTRLTFRHNGIDRRLTDVHGHVIHEILR